MTRASVLKSVPVKWEKKRECSGPVMTESELNNLRQANRLQSSIRMASMLVPPAVRAPVVSWGLEGPPGSAIPQV